MAANATPSPLHAAPPPWAVNGDANGVMWTEAAADDVTVQPRGGARAMSLLSTLVFYFQADLLLCYVALLLLVWWAAIWIVHLVAICYGEYKLYRRNGRRLSCGGCGSSASSKTSTAAVNTCTNAGTNCSISATGGCLSQTSNNNKAALHHNGVAATPHHCDGGERGGLTATDVCAGSGAAGGALPGVSVLKPLVGLDANLPANLESFFRMDYPKFELLFCVHSSTDAVIMVLHTLMNKYPHVDARVFTGGEPVGVNPKINNLMPGYRASKYELLLISDAGIRYRQGHMMDMVENMSKDVAVVTQVPFAEDRKGFGATLEKVYFGTAHARMYLAGNAANVVCSTGMSMLLKRSALDDLGGLAPFGAYLAEDYFLGVALKHRWMKLRVAMLPHMIPLEPMQESVLLGVSAGWAANHLFGCNALVFFLCHLLVWMLFDYVLLSVMQNGALPFGKFEFLVAWLYRECLALPLYLRALFDPRIEWRTGAFRLRWGGVVERIDYLRVPPDAAGGKPPYEFFGLDAASSLRPDDQCGGPDGCKVPPLTHHMIT